MSSAAGLTFNYEWDTLRTFAAPRFNRSISAVNSAINLRFIERLKEAIDPKHLLAPGRYGIR